MDGFYKDYPIYIQKELEALRFDRYDIKRHKKKKPTCLRRLKLTVTILRNKASK